jgi:hypothetical protein
MFCQQKSFKVEIEEEFLCVFSNCKEMGKANKERQSLIISIEASCTTLLISSSLFMFSFLIKKQENKSPQVEVGANSNNNKFSSKKIYKFTYLTL